MIYAHVLHEGKMWNDGKRIKWATISGYLAKAAENITTITGLSDIRYLQYHKVLLFSKLFEFSSFVRRNEAETKSATPVGPQFYKALEKVLREREISKKLRRAILIILLSFHLGARSQNIMDTSTKDFDKRIALGDITLFTMENKVVLEKGIKSSLYDWKEATVASVLIKWQKNSTTWERRQRVGSVPTLLAILSRDMLAEGADSATFVSNFKDHMGIWQSCTNTEVTKVLRDHAKELGITVTMDQRELSTHSNRCSFNIVATSAGFSPALTGLLGGWSSERGQRSYKKTMSVEMLKEIEDKFTAVKRLTIPQLRVDN